MLEFPEVPHDPQASLDDVITFLAEKYPGKEWHVHRDNFADFFAGLSQEEWDSDELAYISNEIEGKFPSRTIVLVRKDDLPAYQPDFFVSSNAA